MLENPEERCRPVFSPVPDCHPSLFHRLISPTTSHQYQPDSAGPRKGSCPVTCPPHCFTQSLGFFPTVSAVPLLNLLPSVSLLTSYPPPFWFRRTNNRSELQGYPLFGQTSFFIFIGPIGLSALFSRMHRLRAQPDFPFSNSAIPWYSRKD